MAPPKMSDQAHAPFKSMPSDIICLAVSNHECGPSQTLNHDSQHTRAVARPAIALPVSHAACAQSKAKRSKQKNTEGTNGPH